MDAHLTQRTSYFTLQRILTLLVNLAHQLSIGCKLLLAWHILGAPLHFCHAKFRWFFLSFQLCAQELWFICPLHDTQLLEVNQPWWRWPHHYSGPQKTLGCLASCFEEEGSHKRFEYLPIIPSRDRNLIVDHSLPWNTFIHGFSICITALVLKLSREHILRLSNLVGIQSMFSMQTYTRSIVGASQNTSKTASRFLEHWTRQYPASGLRMANLFAWESESTSRI